jgi:oligopeptide transport system substrate-binding protein
MAHRSPTRRHSRSPGPISGRALDDRTLELRLTRPALYFPALAGGSGSLPVKRELVEAGGDDWWRDPANWVGNGPFRVTAIEPDEPHPRVALGRNDRYWGGRAKLDGIEYRAIKNQAALRAYQHDELDIIPAPVGVMSMTEMETDPVLSRQLVTAPFSMAGVILLNLTKPPFNDKKMREAFAYAFDRGTYCRSLEAGTCAPTLSWVPPGVPGAIETDGYAFDPVKARQALAESSYGGP